MFWRIRQERLKVVIKNMHACIHTAELKTIKLPPKMRKRGRPKGTETTVIGLPKRRKRSNKTVPFLKKLPSEREKSTLSMHVYVVIIHVNLPCSDSSMVCRCS